MPYISIESGSLSAEQKRQLIERLTATASDITHIPEQFFTVTVKELPDENFGIGSKSIDEIKRATNHMPSDTAVMGTSYKRTLKDMTLEELWQLFPIILTTYKPKWKEWAKEEMEDLYSLLLEYSPIINHIGSTAIPGIQAKPIIDILVEIAPDANWQHAREMMEAAGYMCMSASETRMSFNKGYTPDGYAEKVFHIHFHAIGDNDEIRFRDYLNSHPEVAHKYETLKLSLLPKYKHDRDGYTDAKSAFVSKISGIAKSCSIQSNKN